VRGHVGTLPLIALSMVVYGLAALVLREDEALGYVGLGRRLLSRVAGRFGPRP
jgi:hypothetical protein